MPPPPRKIASKIIGGPARHRAGKPVAAAAASSSEDESDDEKPQAPSSTQPKPSASSLPRPVAVAVAQRPKPVVNEDEFETEESEDGGEAEDGSEASGSGSGSGSGEDSSSSGSGDEESSSESDTAKRKMLRPVFVKKDKRGGPNAAGSLPPPPEKTEDEKYAEDEARRRQRADELVQEQLDKNAAARAAKKKEWDDSDVDEADYVDDEDGDDPEAEEAAWRLREIKRVKRDRDAIVAAEKEREEVERRRNLTVEEREAEDKQFLDKQQEDRNGRRTIGFLQKYYHKGAFYQEESKEAGLAGRDVMGAQFQDSVDRSVLPEYLQIRDMTKVGRRGRTRYKDMKSEDTGRWGEFGDRRGRGGGVGYAGTDERFLPDRERDRIAERTGANASELSERKRPGEGVEGDSKRAKAS